MVDGATSRKLATSLVVHQSVGSGSATLARLQRSRCLVASGAFGPDDRDRHAALTRLGDDIGGAAVAAGGVTIPDGEELGRARPQDPAGLPVRLPVRFDVVQAGHL